MKRKGKGREERGGEGKGRREGRGREEGREGKQYVYSPIKDFFPLPTVPLVTLAGAQKRC